MPLLTTGIGVRKPLAGAQLDRGHPLTQSLHSAYIFNDNNNGLRVPNLVDPNSFTKSLLLGGATPPRWLGNGLHFGANAGEIASTTAAPTISGIPFSVFVHHKVDVSTFGGGVASIFGWGTAGANDSEINFYYPNFTTLNWFQITDDQAFTTPNITYKEARVLLTLSPTKIGSCFYNGTKVGTITKTAFPSPNATLGVGNLAGDTTKPFAGFIYSVYVWTRCLSDSESALLNANPYCFIARSNPQKYFSFFAAPLTISVADAITFGDSQVIQFIIPLSIAINDGLTLGDNIGSIAAQFSLLQNDFFTLSDAHKLLATANLILGDNLSLTDLVQLILVSSGISIVDSVGFTDAVVTQLSTVLNIDVTDTLSISDTIAILTNTTFSSYIRRYLNDVIN